MNYHYRALIRLIKKRYPNDIVGYFKLSQATKDYYNNWKQRGF